MLASIREESKRSTDCQQTANERERFVAVCQVGAGDARLSPPMFSLEK